MTNLNGLNANAIILLGLMLVPGYFITRNNFRKIVFYSDRVEFINLLPLSKTRKKYFGYDEVISVDLTSAVLAESESIVVTFLEKGRIKQASFENSGKSDLKKLADHLFENKVPVRLNSFAHYKE
jgi:hypothetical protein